MRKRLGLTLLIGWLLGVGTGLAGLAASGGYYEYHFHVPGEQPRDLVNR